MKTGIELITDERYRQIAVEKWDSEHDDTHYKNELALAAVSYALPQKSRHPGFLQPTDKPPHFWPWDKIYWKPTPNDRVRELVKAGALIAAEIDRIQEGTK